MARHIIRQTHGHVRLARPHNGPARRAGDTAGSARGRGPRAEALPPLASFIAAPRAAGPGGGDGGGNDGIAWQRQLRTAGLKRRERREVAGPGGPAVRAVNGGGGRALHRRRA